jgi:hypothetical protein
LIRLQDRARDLRSAGKVALGAPIQKDFDRVATAFNRALGVIAGGELIEVAVAPKRERIGRGAVPCVSVGRVAALGSLGATRQQPRSGDASFPGHATTIWR